MDSAPKRQCSDCTDWYNRTQVQINGFTLARCNFSIIRRLVKERKLKTSAFHLKFLCLLKFSILLYHVSKKKTNIKINKVFF